MTTLCRWFALIALVSVSIFHEGCAPTGGDTSGEDRNYTEDERRQQDEDQQEAFNRNAEREGEQ